jgi:hypothetical protein
MKIEIPATTAKKSLGLLASAGCAKAAEFIGGRLDLYGDPDKIEVDVLRLGVHGLNVLYDLAKHDGDRSLMMQITSYRNVIESPLTAKVGNLKALPDGLISYLIKDRIDGWLYHKEDDGTFLPWLVREVKYHPASRYSPPSVGVSLSANTAKNANGQVDRDVVMDYIAFGADAVAKRSIPEILADKGYYHETPELKSAYDVDLRSFSEYRIQFGAQFSASGLAFSGDGKGAKVVSIDSSAKFVNDEEAIKRIVVESVDDDFWIDIVGANVFDRQPYHCRLYMFHLGLHEHQWIHASLLKPYEYRPELREKLILPALHRDLIDILTTDMDVMAADIIDGKTGGTTILCMGKPGLGKTLTAEVYSEVVGRPLYRVHSGQLGTDAASVESALGTILKRAARWGAVLLLNEADGFLRKRDNDIEHNAVVAAFLRTLEYFHGLLFMTTNRSDDIDDAILSRCVAIIK